MLGTKHAWANMSETALRQSARNCGTKNSSLYFEPRTDVADKRTEVVSLCRRFHCQELGITLHVVLPCLPEQVCCLHCLSKPSHVVPNLVREHHRLYLASGDSHSQARTCTCRDFPWGAACLHWHSGSGHCVLGESLNRNDRVAGAHQLRLQCTCHKLLGHKSTHGCADIPSMVEAGALT